MKRILLNVLAVVLMVAAFTACGGGGGGFGGSSYTIKMTTEGSGGGFHLSGSGVATVDWGDGSEKVSLTLDESGYILDFWHDYPSASIRTITVNGDNITLLRCGYVTSLDVRGATALTYLDVSGNLTSLDVSKNTALTGLEVSNNQLISLDVSKNTALTILFVGGNQLTSLDVSKNTALTQLGVGGQLTSLDVSKNTALTQLSVGDQLTSLDVSKNTALTELSVPSNQLTAAALNALFGTLHSNTISGKTKTIYIRDNPGTADCDRSIAESKGWRFN